MNATKKRKLSSPSELPLPFALSSKDKYYTVLAFGITAFRTAKPSLAIFDLDGTLIETKSGKVFPKSISDWKWRAGVKETLHKLYHTLQYEVIILTNQKKLSAEEVSSKASAIYADLGTVPFVVCAGHSDPFYRKPHTGLWSIIQNQVLHNEGTPNTSYNPEKSFYCGDMESDACFAHNVGLSFYWASACFDKDMDHWVREKNSLPPHPLEGFLSTPTRAYTSQPSRHIVVLVGPAACGKSTIALESFPKYVCINRDTLKSDSKMKKAFQAALLDGRSVVIDNTNPSEITRREWIESAHSKGYRSTIIFIDIPKKVAQQMNECRHEKSKGTVPHIPDVAYTMFYSKLERPCEKECNELIVESKINVSVETKKYFMSMQF